MSKADSEFTQRTRKPGRPRKIDVVEIDIPVLGVVDKPSADGIAFELLYRNPIMFKKLFKQAKDLSISVLNFKVARDHMKIYAIDAQRRNDLFCILHGNRVNTYYCGTEFEFAVTTVGLQNIFATADKTSNNVRFISSASSMNSSIQIEFEDLAISKKTSYKLDFYKAEYCDWTGIESEIGEIDNYPLKFEMPFDTLKKTISDIKMSESFRIEKVGGDSELMFNYDFNNNMGSGSATFGKADLIRLECSMTPGDIFGVTVKLAYVKPIASSLLSAFIRMCVHTDKKMAFIICLDQKEVGKQKIHDTEVCKVTILTKVND